MATPAIAPTRPSTDNTGTLVYNSNGSYTYTFYRDIKGIQAFLDAYTYVAPNAKADLGDVTYEPTLVHRLAIQFYGNARGTGSNTSNGVTTAAGVLMEKPINIIYDFVPSTGLAATSSTDIRGVVDISKCNECHTKLEPHGGRIDTRYCAVCHNDQRKYGRAEATSGATATPPTTFTGSTYKIDGAAAGDLPAMVHRIHMGTGLTKTGYNYGGLLYEKIGYSMLDGGARMCSKCHSAAPQAANWNTKPSRLACGTCHDAVNFVTGVNHGTTANGGPQLDDKLCGSCHTAASIPINHYTNNLTPNNPVTPTGLANFTYEISSATATATTVSGGTGSDVAIKFRIMKNGTAAVLATPAATITQTLAGFSSAPGFLLAYALPQEGIAAPSDYNNVGSGVTNFQPVSVSLSTLLTTGSSATGAITGPDASGYYIATILNKFPATAILRSVSLQGYFSQVMPVTIPVATADVPRHAVSVVKAITGDTVRRTAIDSAKCASCHEWFEGHGGNRVYQVQVCVTCHVPGLTTSGKGGTNTQISNYYTSFTANDKDSLSRWTGVDFLTSNPVAAYAASHASSPDIALTFPQTTNNFKDMIHGIHAGKDRTTPIRIARNRSGTQTIVDGLRIGFPGILNNCQSCHTYNGYNLPTTGTLLATREEAVNVAGNTTAALANSALALANANDLMTTPFTAACVSCHDSAPAQAHMKLNGGQIKIVRSSLATAGESCAVCHGSGSDFDPVKTHK